MRLVAAAVAVVCACGISERHEEVAPASGGRGGTQGSGARAGGGGTPRAGASAGAGRSAVGGASAGGTTGRGGTTQSAAGDDGIPPLDTGGTGAGERGFGTGGRTTGGVGGDTSLSGDSGWSGDHGYCNASEVCADPGERPVVLGDVSGSCTDGNTCSVVTCSCDDDNPCELHDELRCCGDAWYDLVGGGVTAGRFDTLDSARPADSSEWTDPLPPSCGAPAVASSHALHFDGSRAHVEVLRSADDRPAAWNDAGTFELWFRTTSASAPLLAAFDDGGSGDSFSMYVTHDGLCTRRQSSDDVEEICSLSPTLADGEWHHVAVVGDWASTQTLYEDGFAVSEVMSLVQPSPTGFTRLELGHGPVGYDGQPLFLDGDLDEVRIWYGTRTPREIRDYRATELASTPYPGDDGPSLLGYFRLDETGDASAAADSNATYHALNTRLTIYPTSHEGTLMGFSFDTSPWITPGAF